MSQAMGVAIHLHHCPLCRAEVHELSSLGASLIDRAAQADQSRSDISVSSSVKDQVLARIAQLDTAKPAEPEPALLAERADNSNSLPRCIRKLAPNGLDELPWKKLSASLQVARLPVGEDRREVALHRIAPGGSVANHDHRGTETTVVLTGSFSDQEGLYMPGDFIVKQPGEDHQPNASRDAECICFSVLEAPVRFTGPVTRLINPFLRIYPQ